MRLQRRDVTALGILWSVGLVLMTVAAGVRVHQIGGVRRRSTWPWMHWCLLDDHSNGHPHRRIYLYLLGIYIELPESRSDDDAIEEP